MSPVPDGIYPRILWEAREEIAEPLALIFVIIVYRNGARRLEDSKCCPLVQEGEQRQTW